MRTFYLASASALVVGVVAKILADTYLHERFAVIGSFAGLLYTRNPGIAFGVRFPVIVQTFLILCALFFVCVLAYRSQKTTVSSIGYGLIVGGALTNVLDRVRDGLVTDFFQVGSFAIFNVADSCITIGVVFLLAEIFGLVRSR